MPPTPDDGLSALEYHVLLAVADGPMHGYAIRDAVERDARGALTPRAGSLYRVIARLLEAGLVHETDDPDDDGRYPGRARRYYGLSGAGRRVLAEETRRMKLVATLAEDRLRVSRP
jgi:DNA-binding PadR family transcriptional regulator